MLTDIQVKERAHYIGASEAAAVLGLSRWDTPLQVWMRKTGKADPKETTLAMEVGVDLEDVVAKLFSRRTGKQVRRVNETVYHKQHPFIACNIDRRVVGEDSVLEAKTCSAWKAKEWAGEDIPQEYVIQALHQLAVTGKASCWLAVLIGGNQDFKWKLIERDEAAIRDIIEREVAFWTQFVEPKVMPTMMKPQDSKALQGLFPTGEGTMTFTPDMDGVLDNLAKMESDKDALEGLIEAERNAIKARLAGNAVGETDRYRVTWKVQETRRLALEAFRKAQPKMFAKYATTSKSRVLRISEKTKEAE